MANYSGPTTLDAHVQRLQNLPSFNIHSVDGDGKTTKPWYEVSGVVVREIAINSNNLAVEVEVVSAQVAAWGRLAAQAKRIWEVTERRYRIWRDTKMLSYLEPPVTAAKKGKAKEGDEAEKWKAPTEAMRNAMIHIEPEYTQWQVDLERAEEAYNAALAVQDGFKAKRDMLKTYAVRVGDESAPHLKV